MLNFPPNDDLDSADLIGCLAMLAVLTMLAICIMYVISCTDHGEKSYELRTLHNKDPFVLGYTAKKNGKPTSDNPYPKKSLEAAKWEEGWVERLRDGTFEKRLKELN